MQLAQRGNAAIRKIPFHGAEALALEGAGQPIDPLAPATRMPRLRLAAIQEKAGLRAFGNGRGSRIRANALPCGQRSASLWLLAQRPQDLLQGRRVGAFLHAHHSLANRDFNKNVPLRIR